MLKVLTKRVHKLKQCTNLRQHVEKLYIFRCLITRPENGGKRGGAYFKFQPIGGALIQWGALIRRFTVYCFVLCAAVLSVCSKNRFALFSLFSYQVEAVIVTNLPRGTVVVILTGTTMVIHAVIPEVVVETVQQDIQVSQVEDEVVLGEVVVICQVLTSRLTPTGHKIPVAEEGISRSRMAHGT